MTTSLSLLLPLALALAPRSARALAAPRLQHGLERPVVLIKQDRCASTLLFSMLRAAMCDGSTQCNVRAKAEVFNSLIGSHDYSTVRDQANRLLEDYLSCGEGASCGLFSLSLQKMSRWGYENLDSAASEDLAREILAHGADVIFLTRQNCFAKAVSSQVAHLRHTFMQKHAHELDVQKGCDGWHLYKCPLKTQSFVKNATFHVDTNDLDWGVRSCESFRKLYTDFDQKLRQVDHRRKLSIQHISYEDLMIPQTWRSIYDSLHVKGEIPDMFNSIEEYKHIIENFDEVSQKATAMGYDRALRVIAM